VDPAPIMHIMSTNREGSAPERPSNHRRPSPRTPIRIDIRTGSGAPTQAGAFSASLLEVLHRRTPVAVGERGGPLEPGLG
jgi:hypothetical protein